MKRFLALFLVFCVFTIPFNVHADDLVKEVPDKYKRILGENYVLVDIDYLESLDQRAEEADIFEVNLKEIGDKLQEFEAYSTELELVVRKQQTHIDLLNEHIDAQERIIADLSPTLWDKHKFTVGVLLGGLLVGGAAYGLSQID